MDTNVIAPSINTMEKEFDSLFRIDVTSDVVEEPMGIRQEFRYLVMRVCEFNHLNTSSLYLKTPSGKLWRKREIVETRQLVYYLFKKKYPTYSYSWIGVHFGQDHATVIHGVRTIKNLIDTDKDFREKVERLKTLLNGYND